MQDSSTAPPPPIHAARGPRLNRVYGLRTLYEPGFRLVVARLLAILSVLLYLARAAIQLAGLRHQSLRWDFTQFFTAAQELAAGRDPYAGFLATCTGNHWCPGGYIFPPLLVEALRPLTGMSLLAASATWLLLSHLFLLAAVLVVRRALRPWLGGALGPLLLAAALLFLPLYQSLYFIQVGTLLLLLLALAAAAYLRPAPRLGTASAGAWLAVATVLRVTPLLLAPALLPPLAGGADPGRDRAVRPAAAGPAARTAGAGDRYLRLGGLAGMAAAGAGLVALLALLTPFTTEYFTTVLPRIGGGTPVLDNESLAALVDRAFTLLGGELPAAASAAITLAVVGATFIVAWMAWRAAAAGAPVPVATPLRAGTFAAFLAALPVASAITWHHHLVTQLLVYALLAPLLVTLPPTLPGVSTARWLIALSYPLMWTDRHVTDPLLLALHLDQPSGPAIAPFLLVTAVNLIGMLCLWIASLLLVSRAGGATPPPRD